MTIDFQEMIEFIYLHSELKLTLEEIEEVLELEEDYLYSKGLVEYE